MDLSVIVPAGRVEPYLEDNFRSVERMFDALLAHDPSFRGELIVALDGISESDVPAWTSHHPFVLLPAVQAKNIGPAKTRNRALAVARGAWIGTVDSDDIIDVDGYVRMFQHIDSTPGLVWVGARIQDIEEDGTLGWLGPNDYEHGSRFELNQVWEDWDALKYLPFHPCASIVSVDAMRGVGGWNESIPFVRGEDVGLWMALNREHTGVWFNENVLFHRSHPRKITKTGQWAEFGITPDFAKHYFESEVVPSTGDFSEDLRLNADLITEWFNRKV